MMIVAPARLSGPLVVNGSMLTPGGGGWGRPVDATPTRAEGAGS